MARQYFNFDEVWGDRAKECVEELLEMESSLSKKIYDSRTIRVCRIPKGNDLCTVKQGT